MLNISGVAHLFGGEAGLVEDAQARLAAQGIAVRAGVAGNPRGAFALARFSAQTIAPEALSDKAFAKLFHDLPLAALGLDAKTIADMARAGLRRIGDVALRPRAPITARFGALPVARLDELSGATGVSIAPRFSPPDFVAERRFVSPVQTVEAIELSLRKLADDLVVLLERQAKGARRVELSLYQVDGAVRRIAVGASRPLNEARALVRLFAEKLANPQEDAIDAGFGIDLMRLACLTAEPLAPSQGEIERAHEAERARALADLIDRLSARLGARAVTRRDLVEAHLPELAEGSAPAIFGEVRRGGETVRHCEERSDEAIQKPSAATPGLLRSARNDDSNAPARPLRLFVRPEPIETLAEVPDGPPLRFRWRRVLDDVAAIEGPERIAPPGRAAMAARPATISAPRILKAAASGSTAKASGAARRKERNGPCMGCSGDSLLPLAEKVAGRSPPDEGKKKSSQNGRITYRNDVPISSKRYARAMRAEPTDAERQLWRALRSRRMQALKFRRQAPVGSYIADFLCIAHRLIVEADGSQHAESRRDAVRDAWLEQQGYTVLRFQQPRHPDGARERAGDDRGPMRTAMVRRALPLIRPGFARPPSPACGRRER